LYDYVEINYEKFLLYEKKKDNTYIYNNHFSKIYSIFKENPQSGEKFEIPNNSKIISNLLEN
jgi:hypothetical protein